MAKRTILQGVTADGMLLKIETEDNPADDEKRRKWKAFYDAAHKHMTERSPAGAALEDQELMRIWGELNSVWDDIEHFLWLAFDSMLSEKYHVTRAIFFSQHSHAARRSMVEELSKQFFWGRPRDLKPLKTAIKRVKARSDVRNELTHGTWGWLFRPKADQVLDDDPVSILEIKRSPISAHSIGFNSKYTKSDLKNELHSMKDTWRALAEAVSPLMRAKAEKGGSKEMEQFAVLERLTANRLKGAQAT
jgi:hypothetical protein